MSGTAKVADDSYLSPCKRSQFLSSLLNSGTSTNIYHSKLFIALCRTCSQSFLVTRKVEMLVQMRRLRQSKHISNFILTLEGLAHENT